MALSVATDDLQEYTPVQTEQEAPKPGAAPGAEKPPSDYLLTYGWAILLALAVLAILYFFLFSKPGSSACVFYSALYCKGVVFTANSFRSNVGFFVENQQSKTLVNPTIVVNVSGVSASGNCTPAFVLQGGDMVCNVAFSQISEVPNSTVSGTMHVNAAPCSGTSFSECSNLTFQNFNGRFTTRVLPSNATSSTSISLEVNTTSPAANGAKDTIIATVQFLGSPLPDANVTFSQTGTFAALAPTVTTTDTSGRAATNISSTKAGSTIVTASFAGESANVTINFTTPVSVAVQIAPDISSKVCSLANTDTPVITLDRQNYPCSQLPLQVQLAPNSKHTFTCISPISGGTGARYAFSSASACGLAVGQNGTFTTGVQGSSCLVSCEYTSQYLLTESTSPSSAGTLSPGTGWTGAGDAVILSESPNSGYVFLNWVGTGTGSYTGTATSTLVIVRNPITEIANFKQSAITTTSTTITVTSTTSTTVTITSTTSTTTTGTSTSTTSTTSTSTTSTSTTSTSTTSTSTTSTTSTANPTGVLLAQPPNSITLTETQGGQSVYYTGQVTAGDMLVAVYTFATSTSSGYRSCSDYNVYIWDLNPSSSPKPAVSVTYLNGGNHVDTFILFRSRCYNTQSPFASRYGTGTIVYSSIWTVKASQSGNAVVLASGPVANGGLFIYDLAPSSPGGLISQTGPAGGGGNSVSMSTAAAGIYANSVLIGGVYAYGDTCCTAGGVFPQSQTLLAGSPVEAATEYQQNTGTGTTYFQMSTGTASYWTDIGADFRPS